VKTTKIVCFNRFRGVSKPTIVLDTTVEFVSKTTTLGSYIISHFVHQARQRKEIYSWRSFLQNKGKLQKTMQLSQNNLSTSPHRLAVVEIRSAKHTHGTAPAGWQLLFLFV